MLVVDVHALAPVDLLDLVDQVALGGADTLHLEDLFRVQRPLGELDTGVDDVARGDTETGTPRERVLALDVLVGHDDAAALFVVDDLDRPAVRGEQCLALRCAGFEQLDHAGQTMRDVLAGHTAGVEGPHRQLGPRFTDRLCSHDADGFACFDQPTRCQAEPVRRCADAVTRLVGERRPHPNRGHLGLVGQRLHRIPVDQFAGSELQPVPGLDERAAHLDVFGEDPAVDTVPQVPDRRRTLFGADRNDETDVVGIVVVDDDLLRDVDEPPGQVARVGGPQRRVGETLAGTVRRDEVLEHRQTLAEVRLDRLRDDVALRVGHEAAHAGDLAELHHVPPGAGADHHVHRVEPLRLERGLHGVLDLVGGFGPDLDELLTALVVGDHALLVLVLHLGGAIVVRREDAFLLRRGLHVLEPDRETGAGRVVETQFLDGVEGPGDVGLVVPLDHLLDQHSDVCLVGHAVDVRERIGECRVEHRPAQRRLQQRRPVDRLVGEEMTDAAKERLVLFGVARQRTHPQLDRRVQGQVAHLVGHQGLIEVDEGPPRTERVLDEL